MKREKELNLIAAHIPVVPAPMAGGPSTPRLCAAVSNSGGIGTLAAGYLTPDTLRAQVAEMAELTERPWGVNLFCPNENDATDDPQAWQEYRSYLEEHVPEKYAAFPEKPTDSDDFYAEKLTIVAASSAAFVSFTFGMPREDTVQALQAEGKLVLLNVTSPTGAGEPLYVAGRVGHHGSGVMLLSPSFSPLLVGWQSLYRGVASAVAFVCITRQVGRFNDNRLRAGVVYGGVGTGIALSGVLVLLAQHWVAWPGLWCVSGVVAAAGTIALWRWLVTPGEPKNSHDPHPPQESDQEAPNRGTRILQAGYFFEGLGYIIIGTFLVEAARPIMGERAGLIVWIIAGCAAAPSTAVWAKFAER